MLGYYKRLKVYLGLRDKYRHNYCKASSVKSTLIYSEEVRGIIIKCVLGKEVLKLGHKWKQLRSCRSIISVMEVAKIVS